MIDLSDKSYIHEIEHCADCHLTDYQSVTHRRYQRRSEMGMIGVYRENYLRNFDLRVTGLTHVRIKDFKI